MDSNLNITAIEILESSLKIPSNAKSVTKFIYDIKIENKTDLEKHSIFSIVSIEILDSLNNESLCSLTVSCIFLVKNFEKIIAQSQNSFEIPEAMIDIINPISLSTARGMLFAFLKGTFLHNAILPIIDPKQFKVGQ